ncbi:methionyl-tRNA formyltransferase [Bryocella elongata]|uniref:Methionyl-tRNA formyltransferase n=1 Tax=Bryocella elongata TaxID=863522 RepID=A0A1H5ZBR0_9BACT|nr:methionyl-tRNA formyltransferase [Bryocella elongata]SEG33741.1 methionyl-tRNA formyltransferase [Bryocella elongata]
MKVVFCGTPEFAVPCLEAVLAAGHEVPLVLTQPDRPAGRKMELQAPPVKKLAEMRGLRILQPEKIKTNSELRAELEAIQPDAIAVVAYGRIIPGWMLELPRFGCINVHGSLLPKYRGAAPIQWAVANGETETGVTTMKLDAGLDTGEMLLEVRIPIGPDTRSSELFPQLSTVGAKALIETLAGLNTGTIAPRPQDDSQASLAPILSKDDGRLKLDERSAAEVYNRFRGFSPWPGAWGIFRDKRFLVHEMARVTDTSVQSMPHPGEIRFSDGRLLAQAADGPVEFLEVQLEGKARMSATEFAKGFQLKPGERVE